jgi:hypothetical protein
MLEQMWKTCLDLSLADKGYYNRKSRTLSEDWKKLAAVSIFIKDGRVDNFQADINVKDVRPTNPNLSTNRHGSDLMEIDNRYILLTIYSCFHY